MKDFIKMTLATLAGLCIFLAGGIVILSTIIGALMVSGSSLPAMPEQGILKIDMSTITLAEQTRETSPFAALQGGQAVSTLGVLDAARAIEAASFDPAVKYIYMKPDGVTGGPAQIEEFRKALEGFRKSGKAIVSYIENPTNGGYYLASVSDRIYMTAYGGGLNMFNGMSSQMIFLKDILDKLGINIQLIRHGKYKSAGEMYIRSASSKENLEQNESVINSVWDSWAAEMASSRDITVEELDRMLDDLKLNSPEDFLANRLVDRLVTKDELRQALADLYVTEEYEDIKAISLQDYAKINAAQLQKPKKDKLAVIYVDGNIMDADFQQQISGDRYAEMIAGIRQDSTVKAVVLRVNSPGGSVLAAEKIKGELDLLQETRPVIASFGDFAASGGYWISAGADYIFTDAATLTGSIGVFSLIPDFHSTLSDKIGVNVTSVKSNRHADMYTFLRPLDSQETAYMQENIEKVYERFTGVVAEGRDLTQEDVDRLGQGRIWTGVQGVDNSLADSIGGLKDAIIHAALSVEGVNGPQDMQIVEYPAPKTGLEILLESFGTDKLVFAGTSLENVEAAFKGWKASESGKVYARLPYEISIR